MKTPKQIATAGAIAVLGFGLANPIPAQDLEGRARIGGYEARGQFDLPDRTTDRQFEQRWQQQQPLGGRFDLQRGAGHLSGPVTEFNRADRLIGMRVINHRDETLGSISDIVVHLPSGKVSYLVLGTGGFLGIGERLVAIPPAAVLQGRNELVLNVPREQIEQAPGFSRDAWPDVHNPAWGAGPLYSRLEREAQTMGAPGFEYQRGLDQFQQQRDRRWDQDRQFQQERDPRWDRDRQFQQEYQRDQYQTRPGVGAPGRETERGFGRDQTWREDARYQDRPFRDDRRSLDDERRITPGSTGKDLNRVSNLIGTTIRNFQGERIASVSDVVLDLQTGRIPYVVIGVGGVLGVGERFLAVPPQAFILDTRDNQLLLQATQERLEQAPGFQRGEFPPLDAPAWGARGVWTPDTGIRQPQFRDDWRRDEPFRDDRRFEEQRWRDDRREAPHQQRFERQHLQRDWPSEQYYQQQQPYRQPYQ